jgi:CheY-like chemotaxis protein
MTDVLRMPEWSEFNERDRGYVINVLCVGINDDAMKKRRALLEQAGYSVLQTTDIRQVIAMCASQTFAVAVLGQHIPAREKLRVTDVVRHYCGARVVELYASESPEIPDEVDAHLSVNSDNFAEEFLRLVKRLSVRKKRKGA